MADGDGDQHWDITQQNIRDIGTIKSEVSSIAAQVDGVQHQMATGFTDMRMAINNLNAPKPQGQWVSIAGLVISLTLALGLVVNFTMTTLKQGTDQQFAYVRHELEESAKNFSWVENKMSVDNQREQTDARHDGKMEARLEALEHKVIHLDEVDHIQKSKLFNRISSLEGNDQRTQAILEESNRIFYNHLDRRGSEGHPHPDSVTVNVEGD